jgi:hypothetical protein
MLPNSILKQGLVPKQKEEASNKKLKGITVLGFFSGFVIHLLKSISFEISSLFWK